MMLGDDTASTHFVTQTCLHWGQHATHLRLLKCRTRQGGSTNRNAMSGVTMKNVSQAGRKPVPSNAPCHSARTEVVKPPTSTT